MAQILEMMMVVSFGLSWPMSIRKSLMAKSTQGKSLFFMVMIEFGYVCGIAGKLVSGNITYVFFFYVLNLIMVGTDICLYFRNRRLETQAK